MDIMKKRLSAFFMGRLYPILIATIVLIGHFLGCEIVTASVIILIAAVQLSVCDSIRPFLFPVITFTCQITLEHTPALPTFSDYLFTEWRLPVVIVLATIIFTALVAFIIRTRLWREISCKRTKLLPALLLLSAAFVLNGVFTETWTFDGFVFGIVEVVFFLVLFMLFYLGISKEKSERELLDYVTYIALVFACTILLQMAYLFAFGDAIVDGSIAKDNITLGWATCNPLGAILVSIIPTLFYGAVSKRSGWIYFAVSVLVYVAAVCTCSRNALLFGTLTYVLCIIIVALKAPKRWQRKCFRVLIVLGIAASATIIFVFHEKMLDLFASFVEQGASDNGRFHLWALAWEQFLRTPIFGGGFFAVESDTYVAVEGMPTMAHNTFLELMSSTGIFGLLSYVYYRVETMRPLLEKPTLGKTLLGLSYLAMATASLLDIFVLGLYIMFFPTVTLAAVYRIYDIQNKDKKI